MINRDSFRRCSDSQIALKISAYTERLYNRLLEENNKIKKTDGKDIEVQFRSNENIIKLINPFRASGIKETWTDNVHLIESNGDFSFDKLERCFSVNILKKVKKLSDLYSKLNTQREIDRIKKNYKPLASQIDILTNAKATQILNTLYKEFYSYAHEQYSNVELNDNDFSNSNLYLLSFPEKQIIKIERTDTLNRRLNDFIPFWGELDYEGSCCLHGASSEVIRLERALNTFLSNYKEDFTIIDENVSIFKPEALVLASKHINIYLEAQTEKKIVFLKGIEKKEKVLINQNTIKDTPSYKENKKVKTLIDINKENIEKSNSLNKLLFVFMKNKNLFNYQYDFERNDIIFRFKTENLKQKNQLLSILHKIERKFICDYIHDNNTLNVNIIQSIKSYNDIVQITFKQKGYSDFLLEYIIPKIFSSLSTIPKKSESLKEDLRLLP